jgi:aldehyde:ferredoxin oxidoreductase
VTEAEYLSREERYDKQLTEIQKVDISAMNTAEKVAILRQHRQEQYEKLKEAVYMRRGWTPDGIPNLDTVKRLGIDFPEVLGLLKSHGVE